MTKHFQHGQTGFDYAQIAVAAVAAARFVTASTVDGGGGGGVAEAEHLRHVADASTTQPQQ